jgi:membrane protein required for colicin V production
MTLFDLFLIALLAYSTIAAFVRGILRELVPLAGLVLGILLASWNYDKVTPMLGKMVQEPGTARIVAFLLILSVVVVASLMLGHALRKTVDAIGLGFFDRLLGAVFGFVRGCLLGVAVVMAIAAFIPQSTWTLNSILTPYFLEGAHAVSFVVPQQLREQILEGAVELKHNAPNWIKPLK